MSEAHPNPLTIPPEMITELALGLEPEADILARYNIDPNDYHDVAVTPAFVEYMASAKASLERQGYDLKYRLRLAAEALLMSSYRDAISATASVAHRFEAAKYFAKIAEVEPKANAVTTSGPAMVIQINLPNRETLTLSPAEEEIIDVVPVEVPDFSMVMAMPDPPPTPPQAEDEPLPTRISSVTQW